MPKIIIKRPHSTPQLIHADSKTLTDLYKELNFRGTHESIGTGMIILVQTSNEYDEPNIIYNGNGILGTVYAVRAGKEKLMDADIGDLEYFSEVVTDVKNYY